MSTEIFVDGICEFDDKSIQSYFSRFGSRIVHYECQRHRPTNACCFAVITFASHHTVNAILRKRPHSINSYPLFVKRLLPLTICSFSERLLPVTSLFVQNRITKELEEGNLKKYFETFGEILRFERDSKQNRLIIEFKDYDSIDRIFLNKDQLPQFIEVHKNLSPRLQNQIRYHGTCRPKEQQPKFNNKEKEHYQDLLQKTIGELAKCKAQLRNTERDYLILQMKYTTMKKKYDRINQRLTNENECHTREEDQQSRKSTTHPKYVLSKRLNNSSIHKHQESSTTQSNTPDDIFKQVQSLSAMIRPCEQKYRSTYRYEPVRNDQQ
ncbi:unnamed protein product [Adineta ricciae]|uniref:RRM domain-containing protein n=1 Tax=Adineta ricciae TaxID=249248 RepID=A0A814QSJ4_ADIRI|nr:unnamed protein product [Adineta ricciae]